MMKRLYLWLRELTLSQQLLTIAFLIVSIFALFLVSVLSPQIDHFTQREMYRMLHHSQDSLMLYLNENPDDIPEFPTSGQDSIVHGIYEPETDEIVTLSSYHFSGKEEENIRANAKLERTGIKDYSIEIEELGNTSQTLYTLSLLEDGRYLISMIPASYEAQFRTELINNIVDMNILAAGLLFALLMVWVATIIHPLNQIKTYVTKLKNDEPAHLYVARRDEIGEVADALREMDEQLQKQNQEKQEMIQNISHDLKTPIATIRSYGESIKDGIYPYGTLEKSIDVIIEHADRLDKKVASLIALNKMGYLLDECPEGDTLDMNKVIEKVLLSLKVIRPEVSFETDLEEDVYFHGDEDPWRIAVENLVDNALRYAKSTVKIQLKEGELSVSNDGSHIPSDRMEKLFKPYEKGTDGRFGLGLSIVHRVVTTYGYRVEADNLTDGVRFRIWKEITKKERKVREKEKKKNEKKKETK